MENIPSRKVPFRWAKSFEGSAFPCVQFGAGMEQELLPQLFFYCRICSCQTCLSLKFISHLLLRFSWWQPIFGNGSFPQELHSPVWDAEFFPCFVLQSPQFQEVTLCKISTSCVKYCPPMTLVFKAFCHLVSFTVLQGSAFSLGLF